MVGILLRGRGYTSIAGLSPPEFVEVGLEFCKTLRAALEPGSLRSSVVLPILIRDPATSTACDRQRVMAGESLRSCGTPPRISRTARPWAAASRIAAALPLTASSACAADSRFAAGTWVGENSATVSTALMVAAGLVVVSFGLWLARSARRRTQAMADATRGDDPPDSGV